MAGFRSVGALGEAARAGRTHTGYMRKVPSQASVAGNWIDLTMAAGNPQPNYYASAPLEAAVLDGMRGIFHGADKAPASLHLAELALCGNVAAFVGAYRLLDYLLYYPFIDFDDTTPQTMIQSTPLPRYTDGEGVRAMMVNLAPTTGGGSFTYDFVNQAGDAKTSPTIFCTPGVGNIATISTSGQGAVSGGTLFLPMTSGDTGIREITGITMIVPNGGLCALVLVKPICETRISDTAVPEEYSFLSQKPGAPTIEDGAYLGLVGTSSSTVAGGILIGRFTFIWND